MISDSTLQQASKNLPLVQFWCRIKEEYPQLSETVLKYCSPFHLYIHVKKKVFHIFQPKRHITTHPMQKEVWESSFLLSSQTLKRLVKIKNNVILSKKSGFCFENYSSFSEKLLLYILMSNLVYHCHLHKLINWLN